MRHFLHQLDKNNFFYNSITTLAYAQFGINELFSRAFFIQASKNYPDRSEFTKYIQSRNFNSDIEKELFRTRTFTPLIFVPGFSMKDQERSYEMIPDQSAVEFLKDTGGITSTNIELTHMTIVTA